jgi:hypothetical protein
LEKDKIRKESVAAESAPPAPPAKPLSEQLVRGDFRFRREQLFLERGKRYPSTSVIYAMIWLHNYDTFLETERGNEQGSTLCQAWK